jgi:hypothetical protein
MKVPAEELEWSLAPGSGGLFGLRTDEKQPEVGLETAGRIIHHIPWERQPKSPVVQAMANKRRA